MLVWHHQIIHPISEIQLREACFTPYECLMFQTYEPAQGGSESGERGSGPVPEMRSRALQRGSPVATASFHEQEPRSMTR